MKILFNYLIIFNLFSINCLAAELPPAVNDALRQAKIPHSNVGILVQELNAATPLIELNARQAMNPASTIKLLTTFAALEMLGPAYSWRTEAWLDGKLEHGVLEGDLVIKGYGNPKLNAEHLWLWLRELKNRGLREIRGNVLLDRSAYAVEENNPAAFDNDPTRAYNVPPDALLLNFNALRLHFLPQGEDVHVFSEPALAGVIIDNQLQLKHRSRCGDWDDNIRIQPVGAGNIIRLSGTYPAICGERNKAYSLIPRNTYFEAVFRQLWQEQGGEFSGKVLDGTTSPSAELYSTHHSQPLSEIIRDINKFSNNVMARQLFLSLSLAQDVPAANIPNGWKKFGLPASAVAGETVLPAPASIARSEAALRAWLTQAKGLDLPELVLENGAGLSRKERISPYSLALILKEILLSPFSAEIEASLPIAGIDGTMRKRHDNCGLTAHAHLKTGSLEGVKSLAGYVQSRSGKQWLVVFIVNHVHAAHSQQAQDELLEWLEQNY